MRVAVTACLLACGLQSVTPQPSLTIRKHQVGPVAIGDSAQTLYARFRGSVRLIDLALEGHLSPALELTFPETRLDGGIVAELVPRDNDLVVWRIRVTNPLVRTEKGIGVGSSVAQLRSAYRLGRVASGEGRVFIVVAEVRASFELDRSGPGGDRLWRLQDAEQVPGDVKIVSVLVLGP